MYIAFFHFEVEPEKQDDFIKAVNETIKPYWESHGCWAYNVYQEYDSGKGPGTKFIKTQIMEGVPPSLEEARAKRSPEAQKVVDLFYSYTSNVSFKGYVKRV
jgi:hypothetical protein